MFFRILPKSGPQLAMFFFSPKLFPDKKSPPQKKEDMTQGGGFCGGPRKKKKNLFGQNSLQISSLPQTRGQNTNHNQTNFLPTFLQTCSKRPNQLHPRGAEFHLGGPKRGAWEGNFTLWGKHLKGSVFFSF